MLCFDSHCRNSPKISEMASHKIRVLVKSLPTVMKEKNEVLSTITTPAEVEALLNRIKLRQLSDSDLQLLEREMTIFYNFLQLLQKKNTTIKQLKMLLTPA